MDTTGIAHALNAWFARAARPLPWRDPAATPWAILVSEFMLQQTQVDRVLPRWLAWLERWPTPSALAADPPGEAVRAWDRLGYPRRALWLHRAAVEIAEQHGDQVPSDVDQLLALTGVGPYTARAVATFAFGERHPVVDTNTRRVIARLVHGRAAAGMPAASDLSDMAELLPAEPADAATFNAAAMELGAIVCTARAPRCDECPLIAWCEWRGSGYPDNAPAKRPTQAKFEGSDRQARGRVMALLRAASGPVTREAATAAAAGAVGGAGGPGGSGGSGGSGRGGSGAGSSDSGAGVTAAADTDQARRAVDSLLSDGLVISEGPELRLP
ncbi:A/G-specific adenine glycosylase [Leucobacter luti]|uniref:Adenine DNA glycosylase n=1 Tax=Leucobacter luti TaxID=340320 RepID=A0A4Q7TYT6_9MICO|nr:A/G-specific adenine glycosylase [Leucobacter luti]MBL3698916.1 A/G-specific adenine glycosylase [Leucobacter luti]RZT66295.1 A/G-specific DNA-adenine glycosylase [Leucobacter luti]